MFIGLILIGIAIYFVFRSTQNTNYTGFSHPTNTTSQSLKILNERYARGKIDESDYHKMKSVLSE
ncbi:MAG: SHOCT domain-containing protein [Eubacteriales bacterium]|nr:SHOCT domain-containing protein [Eubacteriales bacterium]